MAIPAFDDDGNLPAGRHAASDDEVHRTLVRAFPTSKTREAIYTYWRNHRDALSELVSVPWQWLAGSYVTDKPDPNDADIVTAIDGVAFDGLPKHRQLLVRALIAGHYTEAFWNCDVHAVAVYPEDHPGHSKYRLTLERLEAYFGHDREGRPRGFVEVAP